jgi:hypothetical protein
MGVRCEPVKKVSLPGQFYDTILTGKAMNRRVPREKDGSLDRTVPRYAGAALACGCNRRPGARLTWENVALDTRPGLQINYLLGNPVASGNKTVFLVFNGGEGSGAYRFGPDGKIDLSISLLARTAPLFVEYGVSVAVMQPPSDRVRGGMNCGFRASEEHLQDIAKVVESLTQKGFVRIFLAGHSNGAFSAPFAGSKIESDNIKGVVLLSSISAMGRCYIGDNIRSIKYPVLMVHNRDDGCRATPFAEAKKLFSTSPTKATFVEVCGGLNPRGDVCQSLHYHAFIGMEKEVASLVADWAAGREAPPVIGR